MISLKEMESTLTAKRVIDGGLNLDFDGLVIRVETNAPRLVEILAGYYDAFVTDENEAEIVVTAIEAPSPRLGIDLAIKPPDPGKSKIKEEFADIDGGRVVRKRLTGMVFLFGGGVNLAVGPCIENSNQVVNFVNNRFIQWTLKRGCLWGHAAAVQLGGRGLAMAGFSGAGKSTLALHLMSRGVTFVSNDRLMIEPANNGLRMYGVAKLPRVNPGTILNNENLQSMLSPDEKAAFEALSTDDLWSLEHKFDVDIDKCFGPGRFAVKGAMDGLMILNWKRGDLETRMQLFDPRRREDLLPAFMKSEGLFFLSDDDERDRSLEGYASWLSRVQCLEVSGGVDFEKAATTGIRFLETGRFL